MQGDLLISVISKLSTVGVKGKWKNLKDTPSIKELSVSSVYMLSTVSVCSENVSL
jgi:cbb3-type cytochrome oxidase subunit 1